MDKTAEQSYRDGEWLVKQLRAWPERVDMGKTTNITYLMQSAADEIDRLAALSPRPVVGQGCICPPTSEKTCRGQFCPRKPISY